MMGKFESWWIALRNIVGANPEMTAIIGALFTVVALILVKWRPDMGETFRGWVRISRYCHSCPHFDSVSEECAIGAKSGDKCGLVDKTTGMSFTVTKDHE